MAFWKRFNEQLKMYHVKQGKQFVKYALTRRGSQGLTYACAVPSAQLYPDHFQIYRIPKGEYLCVEHHVIWQSFRKPSIEYSSRS